MGDWGCGTGELRRDAWPVTEYLTLRFSRARERHGARYRDLSCEFEQRSCREHSSLF